MKITKFLMLFVALFMICSCDFNSTTTKTTDIANVHAQFFELSIITDDSTSPSSEYHAVKLKSNPGTLPEKLIIPKKINNKEVKAIDSKAFGTTHINTLYIPNTIVYIPKQAFACCSIDMIQVPSGMKVPQPLSPKLNIEYY